MNKIATVVKGMLSTDIGQVIEVGSKQWLNWLMENLSFHYESQSSDIGFTTRREKSGYWYAYKKVSGKLHKRYLGISEDLTIERLEEVAAHITQPSQPKISKVTYKLHETATDEDIAQLWQAIRELRSEVVALGKSKAR